ncbi:winged helix-turn-helix transcriptional regulator [Dactylosporangium sp. CA-233914]|uniref:winged helix-turn-helix transcriptional regulator n=1 Tax=Dactylosporangium sp. CA-233914 TaxID=3239934 RepID=UPI003D8EB807
MFEKTCQTFVCDCHVRAAAELINHAWDPVVLSALRLGPTRRNELLGRIGGVSDKVLTQSLQRLTARGLVTRLGNDGQAPRREGAVYQLSPLGESFASGPLAQLAQWAADNQADLVGPSTNCRSRNRLPGGG